MRKVFFVIFFAAIPFCKVFAQPKNLVVDDNHDSSSNSKFYFPSKLYTDSNAFNEALPKLAEQALGIYKEEKRATYFDNLRNLYYFSNNFQKLSETIDSIQLLNDDNSTGIGVKSYADAKLKEKLQQVSFEKAFTNEFNTAFNKLSFKKKVNLAQFDTFGINHRKKDYIDLKQKLQKKNSDSLELSDMLSVFDKYFQYHFYKTNYTLMSPTLTNPKYQRMYPAIKTSKEWGGVLPVEVIDEKPDPNLKYKLLFELANFSSDEQDSLAKNNFNEGLSEVERQINIHEANGIPRKNIFPVLIVHGAALFALLNNEKYKKKYSVGNPNIPLIKELQDYGVKILVCGQAMTFLKLEKEDLLPGIKQVLSAQSAITSYQLMGYILRGL